MKNIAIFGSTGSIGRSTLEVIRSFPDQFRVLALSANANIKLLAEQVREFKPRFICVGQDIGYRQLKKVVKGSQKLFFGEESLTALAAEKSIDRIVLAISGSKALKPLLSGIEKGKEIALANKEALVCAGSLVMNKVRESHAKLLPIDSEQSAIWQCLEANNKMSLEAIYLTASGGPFRNTNTEDLKDVTLKDVLRHPRWKMGKKITVDSATLMNKGLELIEAMFLFGVKSEKIRILIHPEAIIHSMVEFKDAVILAQLSLPDMRVPIQYALSYPKRFKNSLPRVDFYKLKELHFEKPDFNKFPALKLAYKAAQDLGTAPCVLNASNEVCVSGFLEGKLKFTAIPSVVEKVLSRHKNKINPQLKEVLEADNWAREEALKIISLN